MIPAGPAVDAYVDQVNGPWGTPSRPLRELCRTHLARSTEASGVGCIRHRRPEDLDVAVVRSMPGITAGTRGAGR